jgi:hypothetical protein
LAQERLLNLLSLTATLTDLTHSWRAAVRASISTTGCAYNGALDSKFPFCSKARLSQSDLYANQCILTLTHTWAWAAISTTAKEGVHDVAKATATESTTETAAKSLTAHVVLLTLLWIT